MFEKHNEPVAPFSTFIFRLFYTISGGILLIAIIIAMGMLSFYRYEKMAWIDAFTNASMTFADMGLVTQPQSSAGKFFASLYALFCQFAFFFIFALIFSPIIHRLYHQFHENHKKNAQK
jgi:hypothetical protein